MLYAIIPTGKNEPLFSLVQQNYDPENAYLGLDPHVFFVFDPAGMDAVRKKLQITQHGLGGEAVVLTVTQYGGYADMGLWDWLSVRRSE